MTQLKIGDKAPAFSCGDENGNIRSIKDYKGKKLVLYFYPKDSTPGCTAEACDLRDNYKTFQKKGYEILGVSPDSASKHLKFIAKYELPFSLLADENHAVAEAYGAWGEKTLYGRKYMGILRSTFVIDEKGKIENIIEKVDTKNHSAQLL
ncbi:MAG: thioredoxin-dependent thiol peroxidase [Bacteroidia bacterium]|nr:thioredoxin-dependent thiol peroxidase [Bacteroidia bacterium]MBP7261825.1 thioredoxin-dependent thiol peroxidase [Bacteroidia bacterium]MBP9180470.1 thioredoxin-dependent thiol peroxidase [Bacteroidia bacterium]MBP9724986.1 thioredoxin-dependent thiol peroxidase [Bacteroidia bacterium]